MIISVTNRRIGRVTLETGKLSEYQKNALIEYGLRAKLGDRLATSRTEAEVKEILAKFVAEYDLTQHM